MSDLTPLTVIVILPLVTHIVTSCTASTAALDWLPRELHLLNGACYYELMLPSIPLAGKCHTCPLLNGQYCEVLLPLLGAIPLAWALIPRAILSSSLSI